MFPGCRSAGCSEVAQPACALIKQLQVSSSVLWTLLTFPYLRSICQLSFVAPCTSFLFLFICLLCKLKSQAFQSHTLLFLYIWSLSLPVSEQKLFSSVLFWHRISRIDWSIPGQGILLIYAVTYFIILGLYILPNILFAILAVAAEWRLTSLCWLFSANLNCSNVCDQSKISRAVCGALHLSPHRGFLTAWQCCSLWRFPLSIMFLISLNNIVICQFFLLVAQPSSKH